MVSVFISHSSKDKFFARKLAEKLSFYDVTVWIDEAELKIGDSLVEKIAEAIDKADFVVAVLSHNSAKSNWVQKELQLAMTQEISGKKVKILPLLMESCEVPEFLRDKLYADFSDPSDFDGPMSKLLKVFGVAMTKSIEPSITNELKGHSKKKSVEKSGENSLEEFEDIRLIGIDKTRAYRPDSRRLLYHIYLELSSHPPQVWDQIFEAERQFPRHTMWRHAWLEDNYIVIHCVPEEIKKFHLNDLKEDVENCNAKYREYLIKSAADRIRREKQKQKLEQELDSALDDLDFE